nr:hypothetical protein [Tanacetum cinerariifolium]
MMPVAPPSPDYIPGPEEPQTPPAPQDEDEHELMFIQPHDPDFEDETEDGPVDYPMDGGDEEDDDDGDTSGYDAQTCLRHHLQSPTLMSTPILNRGEYFEEPTRSYQTEVLRGSSCLEEPQTPPATQDENEHELVFIQPHDPNFVPEPIYPEYIPLEDEHILPVEEQPLPPVVSPTTESPRYVAESDPEEDPKEYEDDETEDGPVDHPMDGGDDEDDDDGDSSGYDVDDEDEDEEDEEEEEHLAPADFAIVIPTDELVSPPKGTEPIIPPPSTDTATTGARITIRSQTSISLPPEAEVERLLAMPTPSPSPLTSLPPPSIRERLPPRKRLCLSSLGSRYEVGESSTRGRWVDYGFVDTVEAEIRHQGIGEVWYGNRDTWIDLAKAVPEMAPTTLKKRVAMDSQRVDLLMGDRMTLQETVWIVEEEAYAAQEAWAHSVGLSQTVHHELQTLLTDSRDSLSNDRHETTDGRHAGRVVSTTQIMAPVTRQGQNPPPLNTDTLPHHMTSESVQAMIDQALLRNSTNGDGSQSSHRDNPRNVLTTRPCFYADFMKCQSLNFKGNEGVVSLTRWIEKMESVFNINGCAIENQVKFATCTLLDAALTWWNGQIRALGPEAYAMTWEVLKKKLTNKYCPQGKLKKLDIELWNLKVKGNDVPTYTNRFQELTLICTKFIANENKKIDKYISGLPDNIYGNVKSSQ